jgi:hypothetical protein
MLPRGRANSATFSRVNANLDGLGGDLCAVHRNSRPGAWHCLVSHSVPSPRAATGAAATCDFRRTRRRIAGRWVRAWPPPLHSVGMCRGASLCHPRRWRRRPNRGGSDAVYGAHWQECLQRGITRKQHTIASSTAGRNVGRAIRVRAMRRLTSNLLVHRHWGYRDVRTSVPPQHCWTSQQWHR